MPLSHEQKPNVTGTKRASWVGCSLSSHAHVHSSWKYHKPRVRSLHSWVWSSSFISVCPLTHHWQPTKVSSRWSLAGPAPFICALLLASPSRLHELASTLEPLSPLCPFLGHRICSTLVLRGLGSVYTCPMI